MAVLRTRRNRRKRKGITQPAGVERGHAETNFKGPNINKRHRKPDEIYGDMSIPDCARKE